MESLTVLIALAAAGSLGFGGFASFLTLQALKHLPKELTPADPKEKGGEEPPNIEESKSNRQSNLLSPMPNGLFRLRTGGYFTTYLIEPKYTLYSNGGTVDRLFDDISTMLGADVPAGTGFQFRQAVVKDGGDLIEEQGIGLLTKKDCHPISQSIKYRQLKFLAEKADTGFFSKSNFSLSIYLPVKHDRDHLNNPFTLTFREIRKHGLTKDALKTALESESKLTKRLMAAESKAYDQAARHLQTIENVSPLSMQRLSTDELWNHLYRAHNLNAASSPPLPQDALADIGELLWQETIQFRGNWYALHGNRPVARISMIVPPESNGESRGCYAGVMRMLGNNPLNLGEYTIITEFIKMDGDAAVKKLKDERWLLEKISSNHQSGQVNFKDPEKATKHREMSQIIDQSTGAGKEMIEVRQYLLVYGEAAETKIELEASVRQLEANVSKLIGLMRKTMKGADVVREEPVAIRALYESTVLGEMSLDKQGRELREQASSLSAFAPVESSWQGMERSHTLAVTVSGRLFGFNLLNNNYMNAPGVLILGASRSGKSNFNGLIINDFFALVPKGRVSGVDNGGSLAAICEMCEGRIYNFKPNVTLAINIWDYNGLEHGEMPDGAQINLVLMAYTILLGIDEDSETGKDQVSVLSKAVMEVYREIIPHNEFGVRRIEPRLANLVRNMQTRHYESKFEKQIGDQISARLASYLGDSWLDAETDASFHRPSKFDVYELSGLSDFRRDIKRYLAFCIGARVRNAIGEKINDEYTPTLAVFEECHELKEDEDLRFVLKAAQASTRHGGKNNTVPIFVTHSFKDIASFTGIVENLGAIFIGQQDNIKQLMEERGLNAEVERAVRGIQNKKGSHSQFVLVFGKGDTQIVQPVTVFLSSVELWMFTTDPYERNARALMKKFFPHWNLAEQVICLAENYDRGLTFYGKTELDQDWLDRLIEQERAANPAYRKYLRDLENGKLIDQETILEAQELNEMSEELIEQLDEFLGTGRDQISEEMQALGINIPGLIIVEDGGQKYDI